MKTFDIPQIDGSTCQFSVTKGQVTFVLGANGVGKSSLMVRCAASDKDATLISGNRDIILESAAVELSPSQVGTYLENSRHESNRKNSRSARSPVNDSNWLKGLIARLYLLGSYRNDQFRLAVEGGQPAQKAAIAARLPVDQLNEAFFRADLPLRFAWDKAASLQVTRGSVTAPYGINDMSDGERAALILTASVILAEENQVIFIDEPERHLHRSISSPLLRYLFEIRPDLGWVVATHDLSLPRDFTDASLLVLYAFNGEKWTSDLLPAASDIPVDVVTAVYGAMEKVLFIEGQDGERSLDQPLYRVLFPNVTLRPQRSCNEVIKAVRSLNGLDALSHMSACGLIDRDTRLATDLASLAAEGVESLRVYAVESLYFHPDVVAAIAKKLGKANDVQAVLDDACAALTDADIDKLADIAAKTAFRSHVQSNLPKLQDVEATGGAYHIDVADFVAMRDALTKSLKLARSQNDWLQILTDCKIKATNAPQVIFGHFGVTAQGYRDQALRALSNDTALVATLKTLAPDPFLSTIPSK